MRCNIRETEVPTKCPKCGKRLKKDKCVCGYTLIQEKSNFEKEFEKMLYNNVRWF